MISNRMILNRDFKLSVWFLILILNDFVVMISILILKSFCAWFMILNHQNLPANHQILQVALQAAEQQLLIYFTDCSCSQSYLILGCFYQNSFSYVIDCQFSHRETSCNCMLLVSSLLCGLNTRFSSMFNYDFSIPEAKDVILAAVSHPTYKLKWVPPEW